MAKAKNKKSKQQQGRGLTDTQRWVIGVILFAFALFLFAAVVFSYFHWANDQPVVTNKGAIESGVVMNPTGPTGAKLAHYLVGEAFGVFGLVVPIVLIILALRILNYRPAILNKSIRVALIVAILGSLTLGYIFRDSWSVFGSGLGGMHGIIVSDWMKGVLGALGTGIVLLLGWILTAVYINSKRTISTVNKMGHDLFKGGQKVKDAVMDKATDAMSSKDKFDEDGVELEDDYDYEDYEDYEDDEFDDEDSVEGFDADEAINPYYVAKELEKGKEPKEIAKNLGYDLQEISEEESDLSQETPFKVMDNRYDEDEEYVYRDPSSSEYVIEQNGVFKVVSRENRAPTKQKPTPVEPQFVVFGEEAGAYTSSATREESGEQNRQPLQEGFVVRDNNPQPTRDTQSVRTDSGLQIVDYGSYGDSERVLEVGTEEMKLSMGGVVEARSDDGITVDDRMQVVVEGRTDEVVDEEEIEDTLYDPTKDLSRYQRPPLELLENHRLGVQVTEKEIHDNKDQIVSTLDDFGIKIDKIKATIGPTVTLYEIVPAPGVRISRIKNLEDDIALSLKALGIRIIAPMPGQGTVGIEVPNKNKEIVSMYSVLKTKKFQESDFELPVALGKTISNETFVIDLAKMPHLLVAGATGQGKSVGLNAIITSLLYTKHPSELKFVMVDPKRVELSLYNRLEKHYLAKMESEDEAILTDTQKVVYTLNALCEEMSDRYKLLGKAEVRKIAEYNERFVNRRLNPNKGHRFLPYIVVVIDEFADMIMTAGREIETPITRLAQLARAVGIHLVIATQRPDVKVITGLIKANFPARIAYRVMSMVDSRTIIDQPGANQLIGRGDMLLSLNGVVTRIQCAFVDTPEIERLTEFIGNQRGYPTAYVLPDYEPESDDTATLDIMDNLDAIFPEVANFIVQNQQGSTSAIQRRFSVGYNRAGRIMDQLEGAGIVGGQDGSRPREVLISDLDSLEYILGKLEL